MPQRLPRGSASNPLRPWRQTLPRPHTVHERQDQSGPSLGLLRYSLVVVWLATAFVSVWELHGQSLELLAKLPLPLQHWATTVVLAGAAVDAVIGLWLAWRPSRMAYATALAVMIGMTLAATAIDPGWWLHPLGPLTKNLPIAAILWTLWRASPASPARPNAPSPTRQPS